MGERCSWRKVLQPAWPGIVAAIGGGPQIVRSGAPVFNAGESFTTRQLGPRAPRSAVGQLRDGRIVLVAVDGRQPGYSVGLTMVEAAQLMIDLGAEEAINLDGGGSTTFVVDGAVVNRPPACVTAARLTMQPDAEGSVLVQSGANGSFRTITPT